MRYNRSAGGRPVDTVDSVGKGPRFEVQESPLVETCSGTMDTSTPAKIAGNTRPQHSLYTPCARLYSAILGSSPGRLRPQASSPSKVGKDGRRKDTYIIYYTVPHITTEKEKKARGHRKQPPRAPSCVPFLAVMKMTTGAGFTEPLSAAACTKLLVLPFLPSHKATNTINI